MLIERWHKTREFIAFETSTQSTWQTILPKLTRSLVMFRSTAPQDKVSQSPGRLTKDNGLVGSIPIGEWFSQKLSWYVRDETPWNRQKLGIITELHHRKDCFSCSVTLRTAKGNHISRLIEKLCPIEVSGEEVKLKDLQQKKNEENVAAAQEAIKRIKELSELWLPTAVVSFYTLYCITVLKQYFIAGQGSCHECLSITLVKDHLVLMK